MTDETSSRRVSQWCETCHGHGYVGHYTEAETCPDCGGDGL